MNSLNFNSSGEEGQVKTLLSRLSETENFPHALLLEGSSPEKRAELAKTLAQAAVCQSGGNRPCGNCPGCVKAQAGSHPDILVLDGETDTRAFPIDVIRKIRSDAYIRPNEAPRRVFVLLGAHNMAEASQNALLKVLEEPPENVIFILTATSSAALLPTVRSRAQSLALEEERAPANADMELTAKIAAAITAKNESDLLFLTAVLIRDKDKLRAVLSQMELVFRDAAVLRSGGTVCLSGQKEAAAALGTGLTREKLLLLLQEIRKSRRALDQNANAALLVTALCANLREAAGR